MKFPIRQEIEVLPADEPDKIDVHDQIIIDSDDNIKINKGRLALGWTFKETIGMAIVNQRALKNISKSVIIGK